MPAAPSLTPKRSLAYQPPPDTGLQLVYEDAALIAIDKPAGLLTVPGRGAALQDCLLHRVQARYPGALLVHRLDEATSGLLLFALQAPVQRALGLAFARREVHKTYVAVVHGLPGEDQGQMDWPLMTDWLRRPLQKIDPLQGKPARTNWRVLDRYTHSYTTRLELSPQTGRTHQLRVHLLALGHPIVGDRLYGPADTAHRLHLHATQLRLTHPASGIALELDSAPGF